VSHTTASRVDDQSVARQMLSRMLSAHLNVGTA